MHWSGRGVGLAAVLIGSSLQAKTPPAGDSLVRAISSRQRLEAFSVAVVRKDAPAWRWQIGGASKTTGFRVGSVSKLFTVAIAARLLKSGRFELDAPIEVYLRDLPPAYGALTSRQLAGHLAGVRHYGRDEYLNRTAYPTVRGSLGVFLKDSLLSPPGEATPMTLDSTGTAKASVAQDLSDRWPSGGIVSSAKDLGRFALGIFAPGYLADSLRTLLVTSQRTSAGAATRVGLGWRIAEDSLGRRYLHHGGSSVGGRAFLLVFPGLGVAVALVANTEANIGEAEALAFARLALDPAR